MRYLAVAMLCLFVAAPAFAGDAPLRPDSKLTPGDARSGVTAADLCPVAHTPALRNVTQAEKLQVYKEYGMAKPRTGYCATAHGCEVDHLISLEIGGSNDIKNLWPQSYDGSPWNAHVKDKLENKFHAMVCAKTITLAEAQHAIATDWIAAYTKYLGTPK